MVSTKIKSIDELKVTYVKYYEDVPIQKYAAMAIGRDEDTIIRWRKEDKDFADAVQRAKAEWIRKKLLAVKAEFALERLEREVFSHRVNVINELSPYDQYIANNQIDPNTPENRIITDKITEILMDHTARS